MRITIWFGFDSESAARLSGTIEGRFLDEENKVLKIRFQRAVQAKACVAGMPKVSWA